MNFYRIQHSLDNKIVGTFGQIIDSIPPDGWESKPNFVQNISFRKFDGEVLTAIGLLDKKAKLTDLLSTVPVGFAPKLLVSKAFKELFENLAPSLFQFFSCDIEKKGVNFEYWLASPLVTGWNFVDFTRSETLIRKNKPEGGTIQSIVPIDNLADFNDFVSNTHPDERWNITVEKVNVTPEVNVDLFVLDKVDGGVGYFVSERFKQAVEVLELTGIEFKPSQLNLGEWLGQERQKYYRRTFAYQSLNLIPPPQSLEFFLTSSILHEFVHFGNTVVMDRFPSKRDAAGYFWDAGKQFEEDYYGGDIGYDITSGKIIFTKYQ